MSGQAFRACKAIEQEAKGRDYRLIVGLASGQTVEGAVEGYGDGAFLRLQVVTLDLSPTLIPFDRIETVTPRWL